ncbi:MAG TPA: cupin domain-containing protein [Terriglobia bacterium]|nr:cupin domain-containing protein [Terriglobia bacterium]
MRGTRRHFIRSAGALGAVAAAGGWNEASASQQPRASEGCAPLKAPEIHCVVTGRNKAGKSVIVSNAPAKPVTVALFPGYQFYRLWGSDSAPALPADGTPTSQSGWFPPKNGFRFGFFTLPPATSTKVEPIATPAALEETRQKLPGMLDVLEPDHPGMHTTDSVDFDVVVFGEVVMELDDGAEVVLKAGDCVIQNGTRHAWHNRSSDNCVIAFSLVGAERKGL